MLSTNDGYEFMLIHIRVFFKNNEFYPLNNVKQFQKERIVVALKQMRIYRIYVCKNKLVSLNPLCI